MSNTINQNWLLLSPEEDSLFYYWLNYSVETGLLVGGLPSIPGFTQHPR